MCDHDMSKPPKRWTAPEKWQVITGVAGVLIAVVTVVGQFAR